MKKYNELIDLINVKIIYIENKIKKDSLLYESKYFWNGYLAGLNIVKNDFIKILAKR